MSTRPRALITQFVHEPGPSRVREQCDVIYWDGDLPMPRDRLIEDIPNVDAMLCHTSTRVDADLLDHAPNLKVISNLGAGYDNIDVAACTSRRVAVCNTPGAMVDTTADTAFALMLGVARRVGEGERFVRGGRWTHWSPTLMVGGDVWGATLGLVGLGKIGLAMARRARGFGMTILYHTRNRRPEAEAELGVRYADLDTLLRESDYVSLHCPLTPETGHLIGARELALMKPTAYLINTARGPVVDQPALAEALAKGTIAGAGLDVYEREPIDAGDPLLALENCLLIPHVGAASRATRARMAGIGATNLLNVLAGQPPVAIVNPEVLAAS